jgi:hypothetical protein
VRLLFLHPIIVQEKEPDLNDFWEIDDWKSVLTHGSPESKHDRHGIGRTGESPDFDEGGWARR